MEPTKIYEITTACDRAGNFSRYVVLAKSLDEAVKKLKPELQKGEEADEVDILGTVDVL